MTYRFHGASRCAAGLIRLLVPLPSVPILRATRVGGGLLGLIILLLLPGSAPAQVPSIVEKTDGMERMDGYFPIYWDEIEGRIWLEISRFDEPFLYVVSQPAGLGSNDVGLDRTQLGGERIVHFERVGPKILLVAPNLRYRAETENEAERASVRDAFAESVVWGFTAAAAGDGRVLVDATDFVVRDAHGVQRRLRETDQGSFQLDPSRSSIHLATTRAFPENTEMEARLTFTSDEPGDQVREVAADPFAVTLRVRHSFVKLPPPGYEPRRFDPRSGFFGVSYRDYSAPIGHEIEQRFIARHRLAEGDTIVYHLDPGTPEPVRTALLDGARWWADAFAAAGHPGAFRVEMLPEGADPMDIRYNVIQWVHRATRGWSYGSTVTDPRTGEIIKGHVLLGSLRVRQDYLIAEGLLTPYNENHADGFPPEEDPMLEMALARIRQLSAHEVGHTLGLAHNFAASVDDRASVMDYPAPLVALAGTDSLSLADAYDTGVGTWDVAAIRYGYTVFSDSVDEQESLDELLAEAHERGFHYITDADARPAGAAHPLANLWDNGRDVVDNLRRELRIRDAALNSFGLAALREGQPVAQLEEVLVPLYLRHRYQVDATAKAVGGVEYSYALRGDTRPLPAAVPGPMQEAAVDALLEAVTPAALKLPAHVRTRIPPRPPGYEAHRELFDGYTGLTFDPYAPAEAAARMVFTALLHPQRAARLAYQKDFDPSLPGLLDVLDRVTDQLWKEDAPDDPYEAELHRLVQTLWTEELMDLARDPGTAPAVEARVHRHLVQLHDWLDEQRRPRNPEALAHRASVYEDLDRYLFRDYRPDERRTEPTVPPGSPIGDEDG